MRLFENVTGYATEANAEKKLRNVAGENIEKMHWIIAVKDNGRFVPVVTGWPDNERGKNGLAMDGICIVG